MTVTGILSGRGSWSFVGRRPLLFVLGRALWAVGRFTLDVERWVRFLGCASLGFCSVLFGVALSPLGARRRFAGAGVLSLTGGVALRLLRGRASLPGFGFGSLALGAVC